MEKNNTPIIQVEHLVAQYEDRTILEDINFKIYPGEIFMILGGSGSGKTTLMNHMIGLLKPAAGNIIIENKNIVTALESERLDILKNIGVMYQSGALFGSMNLLENVRFPLEELSLLPLEAMNMIALNKLQMVGLGGFGSFMPAEISGGMKKRAAIARAMALDPLILFLDEPSAGLDPIISSQLDQLILKLSKTLGITFVIVSHELRSIYSIAQRVIVLHRGIIADTGDPNILRDHSKDDYVQKFLTGNVIHDDKR